MLSGVEGSHLKNSISEGKLKGDTKSMSSKRSVSEHSNLRSEVIVEVTTDETKESMIESPSSILPNEDTTIFSHPI